MSKNFVKDAVLGFAIGDALGVPFEFKLRDSFKCTDMVGYGTHNQPKGTWSDDTSMVLATMKALYDNEMATDLEKIMENFRKWRYDGEFTPWGKCFDIGGTTAGAIIRSMRDDDPNFWGNRAENTANGNGALMRILPFAFADYPMDIIDTVAALTHNTTRSKFACQWYIDICRKIITGVNDFFDDPYLVAIKNMSRDQLDSSGYVIGTLVSAIWCFLNTNNYKDCVLMAVNLGNDTDTVAALAGALAGLQYGYENIPTEWINNLACINVINAFCDLYYNKLSNN